jgi:hypothetical protein
MDRTRMIKKYFQSKPEGKRKNGETQVEMVERCAG